PACSAALPMSTSIRRSGPPRKPRPSFIGSTPRSSVLIGQPEERPRQDLDAVSDVYDLRVLVWSVAVAALAWHEEHGGRTDAAQKLSVVTGVAGHPPPRNAGLLAGGLQTGADVGIEANARLSDQRPGECLELAAGRHLLQHSKQVVLQPVER